MSESSKKPTGGAGRGARGGGSGARGGGRGGASSRGAQARGNARGGGGARGGAVRGGRGTGRGRGAATGRTGQRKPGSKDNSQAGDLNERSQKQDDEVENQVDDQIEDQVEDQVVENQTQNDAEGNTELEEIVETNDGLQAEDSIYVAPTVFPDALLLAAEAFRKQHSSAPPAITLTVPQDLRQESTAVISWIDQQLGGPGTISLDPFGLADSQNWDVDAAKRRSTLDYCLGGHHANAPRVAELAVGLGDLDIPDIHAATWTGLNRIIFNNPRSCFPEFTSAFHSLTAIDFLNPDQDAVRHGDIPSPAMARLAELKIGLVDIERVEWILYECPELLRFVVIYTTNLQAEGERVELGLEHPKLQQLFLHRFSSLGKVSLHLCCPALERVEHDDHILSCEDNAPQDVLRKEFGIEHKAPIAFKILRGIS